MADPALSNDLAADPTLNDPMASDLGTVNASKESALPTDETLADDMALADTAAPKRDDNDFPWGLLGLLGLKGKDDDYGNSRRSHH